MANWDASARAWLRSADEVKKLEQTQLLLVMKNVKTTVNTISNTSQSVIQAWRTAMSTAKKLIRGMPHQVHDGAILLGLSAWHLYPDLVVLGSSSTLVKQKDPLIAPGGLLTIGLERQVPETFASVS